MKRRVVFIHGISIFGSKKYTKEDISSYLRDIENKNMNIIRMYGNNNAIFKINNKTQYVNSG